MSCIGIDIGQQNAGTEPRDPCWLMELSECGFGRFLTLCPIDFGVQLLL